MKIPDKIYITHYDIKALPEDERLGSFWHEGGASQATDIEYVRTGAILNWVKEQEKNLKYPTVSADAYQLALNMLKEKLSKL